MSNFPMIAFYCESIQASERTVEHHATVLSHIFVQLEEYGVSLNEESIDGLSGAALQRWLNAFKKDHKPTTVNNMIVTLNPFLRWAHKIYPNGVGDFGNILKTMRLPDYDKLPEEDRPKDKYYTDAQIAELLAVPKRKCDDSPLKKRDRAIMAMYLASGLRAFELCQLRIGSLTDHGHGYVYIRRKGGAWKTTEVAEFAYPYIEEYLKTRKDRNNPEAYLFITTHGDPCNPNQLYKSMRHRQDKVAGENYQRGNHAFRHTFVSSVEKIGGGAVARDLANHKSIAITNRYDHSTAEQRRESVDALRYGLA